MRTECLNYRYTNDCGMPICRLIANVGNKMQVSTQRYDRRPYGVGLLVAGYDVSILVSINFSSPVISCLSSGQPQIGQFVVVSDEGPSGPVPKHWRDGFRDFTSFYFDHVAVPKFLSYQTMSPKPSKMFIVLHIE